MADEDYLPPVVAEIILRTNGFRAGVAEAKGEMAAAADSVSGSSKKMASDVESSTRKVEESTTRMSKRSSGAIHSLASAMQSLGWRTGGVLGVPLQQVGHEMDKVDQKAKGLSGTLQSVGRVATIGGLAGFAGAAYEGVKAAEKFQTSLARIAADSNRKNAQQIGSAFLGTMGKSAFSANEQAQSFAAVSRQLAVTEGHYLSAAQAAKVMAASSDLAEGAQTSLGQATASVAQVMQAYHLSASQASQAADTLYATSRATDSGIGQIAMAVSRLHARLGQLAPSLQDVSGLMVAAAKQGLTGSRGIMQISSAFTTLVSGGKTSSSVLQALGAHIYDAQGRFVGLQSVIGQLHGSFASLTPRQQEFAAKSLFGAAAMNTMLSVINAGPAAFEKDAQAASRAGAAHKAAEAQSHTLKHEIDVLKATIDDLGVKFGTFLIPKIEAVAHAIADVIGWFEKHKAVAEALAGVIGGVLATAVTAFAAQKLAGLITMSENTVVGLSKIASFLTGGMIPALERTGPGITGIGVKMTETAATVSAETTGIDADIASIGAEAQTSAAKVTWSTGEMAGSFSTLAGDVTAATATIDSEIAGMATADATAAGAIAESNAAIATSFAGVLSAMTPVLAAFAAYEAFTGGSGLNAAPGEKTTDANQMYGGLTAGNRMNYNYLRGPEKSFFDAVAQGYGLKRGNAPGGVAANNVFAALTGSGGDVSWKIIAGFLRSQGLSNTAIAGILGNFAQETGGGQLSGITSMDTGPNGIGIAQWIGSRRTAETAYAKGMRVDPTSLFAQLEFLLHELRTDKRSAYTAIQGASTAQKAAALFNQLFEGGSDPGGVREKAAQAALKALGGAGGGPSSAAEAYTKQLEKLMAAEGAGNKQIAALMQATATGKGSHAHRRHAAATATIPAAVATMLQTAYALQGTPYSKAGHGFAYDPIDTLKKIGIDCSGFVSRVLHSGGVNLPISNTATLPGYLQKGAGKYVTVYDRNTGPFANQHTLIDILGHFFESGGNPRYNPTGRVTELTRAQAAGELAGGGFAAFHPILSGPMASRQQLQALGISGSFSGASSGASLQSAINQVIGQWASQAKALLTRLGNAGQVGSASSLERLLGVRTSGSTRMPVSMFTGPDTAAGGGGAISALPGGRRLTSVDVTALLYGQTEAAARSGNLGQLTSTLTQLSSLSAAGRQFQALVAELRAAGLNDLAKQLVAAHKQAMTALAQEMVALQQTKDAATLQLQATQLNDQTKMIADGMADWLKVGQDAFKVQEDQVTAQTTAIKDMTTTITDEWAAAVQQIQDETQLMADSAAAAVTGIGDQTQIQVDILGEKGLYGLGLIAQKEQVLLDITKAGFDQQIAKQQEVIDNLKIQADIAEAAAKAAEDLTRYTQDQLVAAAQSKADIAQQAADTKILIAQQHSDSVALAADINVMAAQNHVDLTANAPKSVQDAANANLKFWTAMAGKLNANANAMFSGVNSAVDASVQSANQMVTSATDTASNAAAGAAENVASVSGYWNDQIAGAGQVLQGIQDTADIVEAGIQGQIAITNAQQGALERGGGTFNPYSTLMVGPGGITLVGGGGPLPWQAAPGAEGVGTQVIQNYYMTNGPSASDVASESMFALRPYLTAA